MYPELNPRPIIAVLAAHKLTLARLALVAVTLLSCTSSAVFAQLQQSQVIRNITQSTERLEMTVNSSRILTLEKRIPRMVVNNPELVTVTPISANQVQLAARKPGVTQVNLWDEDDQVYTVDVMIYGDVRELELALERLFPESSIKVMRLTNSLVLEGFVEKPESVSPIIRLAEDYAPKIINNISVGGVQQVMLKVKVMEVSRTKLRNLGFDFVNISGDDFVASSVSGLLSSFTAGGGSGPNAGAIGDTFRFGIVDGNNAFFGFLQALQQNDMAKILADPTITAVSGRPAHFNVGGETPIIIPSGLGQTTVEYKPFGTAVDFVPIVLGNGNIRLEVRPRVSEIDESRTVEVNGFSVPSFKVREVDTGVEMKAGQTLALAGLVQTRVESQSRGLPYVSDLPYVGAAFRSVREVVNEVELLILVTPELVDGMDPHEVPVCGPGMETVSPNNCQLYFGGHLEVPACGACAPTGCGQNCYNYYNNPQQGAACVATDGYPTPAQQYGDRPVNAEPGYGGDNYDSLSVPAESLQPSTPVEPAWQPSAPGGNADPANNLPEDPSAMQMSAPWLQARQPAYSNLPIPQYQQYQNENQPHPATTSTPGLMGPIGYDMEK